jgi:hypothetical protein
MTRVQARVRSYGKQGADIKSMTAPKNRAIHSKLVASATWREREGPPNCISYNLSESRTDLDNPKVLRPFAFMHRIKVLFAHSVESVCMSERF